MSKSMDRVITGAIGAVCVVSSIGAVEVANQVMDKKLDKDIKPWKRRCVKTGVYLAACSAASWATGKAIGTALSLVQVMVNGLEEKK